MTVISKVILNGTTLMDATSATATADKIISPYTAMTADGAITTGTASGGGEWTTEGILNKSEPNGDLILPLTITAISAYALSGCTGITSITGPGVITIGEYALRGCTGLTSINMPNLSTLNNGALQTCNHLSSVNLPEVTSIGSYSFQSCGRLKYCVLPKVTAISNNAFMSALGSMSESNRAVFDFGCTSIATFAFNTARYIGELILRSNTMCALANVNAFANVNTFHNTGAKLYVPQSLISEYQANTNWAAVLAYNANNQILPIEGSYYETHYADGTPIE